MTSDDPTVAEFRHPSGLIGQTVSHYRILQRLGSGGMGVVYKAVDTRLGRTVALKFLSPDFTRDPIAKERFIREAQTASGLDHPNICTIYEVDELDGGQLCLAMAYYEGRTIRELLRDGPLPLPTALDIARQTARGLARAHEAGIIHRDIKPENILITQRGEVKILDFGIAKIIDGPGVTRVGMTVGTPMYMSPEQVAGDPTDQRTDVWSLGIVLYEMVKGRRPFSGAIAPDGSRATNARLTKINFQLLSALEQVIAKCLQIDAEERYRDANGLMVALDALAVRDSPPPPTTKRTPHFLSAATALVACVLFTASFIWIERRTRDKAGPFQDSPPPMQQAAANERMRIAVLPFKNLGPTEDAYFTEGITEEITSRLAAIPGLGVISRTSASQYKNPDKSMQQIGKELNVAYVLEGTVRWDHSSKSSSRILVTPQLIRVADDTHLWSAKYEREMEEIFKVQSDIAVNIIEQLNLKLVQPESQEVSSHATSNVDAYHAYLRGLAHLEGLLPLDEESGRAAIKRFEESVRLDPGFALAYASLSRAQSALYQAQFEVGEEILAKAEQNAKKALALQPDLPEGYIAMGYYHYWGHRAYDQALRAFSIATKAQPNNNEVRQAIAYIKRRQGFFEESAEDLERAFALDPRNPFLARSIGITLTYLRRYEEADKYYELSISLDPSRPLPYANRVLNRLLWKGSVKEARILLAAVPPSLLHSDIVAWSLFHQDVLEGRLPQALQRLASGQEKILWSQEEIDVRDLLAAEVYEQLNDQDQAKILYQSAKALLEQQVKEHPQDARVRSALARALAGLGQKDRAIRQAKIATQLPPKDAFLKPVRLEDLAVVYAVLGEQEAALDEIEYLLSIPSLLSPQYLKIDPRWSPLRGHPRFETLIQGNVRHRSQ